MNNLPAPSKNRTLLNKLIAEVKEGMEKGLKAGIALKRIRDERLWDEDYDSLDHCCNEVFGFGQSYAYRLIEWSDIKISPIGEKIENEAQARAISKVPKSRREAILKKAAKKGRVTGNSITEAMEAEAKAHANYIDIDKEGHVIPKEILQDWNEADEEFRELVSIVSSIKNKIDEARKNDRIIYRGLTVSAIAYAQSLYSALKAEIPYSVCTECNGFESRSCTSCKGRGFFGKHIYDHAVPVETKEFRKRVLNKGDK